MKHLRVSFLLAAVLLTASCAPAHTDASRTDSNPGNTDTDFKTSGYKVRTPTVKQQPWREAKPVPRRQTGVVNAQGIQMYEQDGRLWEHPVRQSGYGLRSLSTWRKTHDRLFLDRAVKQADHLMAQRVEARGAWFFAYTFKFPSPRHNLGLTPPWYSAMAQGQALSLYVQLANDKGVSEKQRARYRTAADKVFASLLLGPEKGKPWVTHVDEGGYLWLEEYPKEPVSRSDFTFNGHNFALMGVWDYHHMTNDPRAARVFDGALTTVTEYAGKMRRPGGISSYCLNHDVRDSKYHGVVTHQLREMYWLSGEAEFLRLHQQFAKDHKPSKRESHWDEFA